MRQSVISFIQKHKLLSPHKTILVGVSGGPDSMALLHFLCSIQNDWGLKIVAVAIDHQLRGDESRGDIDYVKLMCEKWNIDFYGTSVDVPSYKIDRQVGTELAARELRYGVFAEQMKKYNADYLALGHHGDDQVETMLMGITRYANSRALGGIPVKRNFSTGKIIRPLLCVSRMEIERYCSRNHIIPRRDSSNEETDFTRNYFRKYIVPLLKEQNRNIHTTVQHLSESLQDDEQFLMKEAHNLFKKVILTDEKNNRASLEISEFETYCRALQRRVYHLILNYLYDELPNHLSYMHEEQFFALLKSNKANARIDFPHGLIVEKSYQRLNFYFSNHDQKLYPFHKTITLPGKTDLPNGSKLMAIHTEDPEAQSERNYLCGVDQVDLPLHIRTRRAGDRMRWAGLNGSKKVKDIFIDAKIPVNERDKWPIVTDNNGEILWLIGLKKGTPARKTKSTSFIQLYYDNGNL
ncbi:tRNA lysidine(34) synthetase TilS [Virgibacillus oceani]|uniref:tRNA(Ile)-lysidine synthase n=1 Tax=Virgibacillus oceani TaxID=1479511 RepID=A0A917HKL2_9BACI|nr:tRNA lysidine(34) synthetase TilS [Virgibacillus oceani]GGG81973.1 tRNA(Ile)-lysidine synthase [Virgibacillus oceani]